MGCCNNPNYQSRAARESINRSAYEACQCADRACECRDLAEQYAENAEETWNDFQTRYLGAYSVAPVTSTTGALYFNTVSNQMFVWNGTTWTAVPAATIIGDGDKGDITVSGLGSTWMIDNGAVTSAKIADGTIVNGDISNTAAIDHSKLANITAGQVLLGNASNVPTSTTLSGDVTVNSSGVTAIGSGVIVNADVNASAAIAGTKISPNFGSQNVLTSGGIAINGSPAVAHSVSSNSSNFASPQFSLTNNFNGNGNFCPFIVLNKQRGSSAVQNGDRVGSVTFQGYDGTNFSAIAEINASVSGTVSSGIVPGDLNFNTETTTGSLTTKLVIKNDGNVGIGTTPSSKLHIDGDLTVSSATTANTATAGAQTLPANPVGFLVVSINGTSRKIPYYAT